MEARIDPVTDVRDTRPTFGITYRRWSDTRASHATIQANNLEHAVGALADQIGNYRFSVTAARQYHP